MDAVIYLILFLVGTALYIIFCAVMGIGIAFAITGIRVLLSNDSNASDYYANQISRTNIEILRQQQVS